GSSSHTASPPSAAVTPRRSATSTATATSTWCWSASSTTGPSRGRPASSGWRTTASRTSNRGRSPRRQSAWRRWPVATWTAAAKCQTAGEWRKLAQTLFASGYFAEAEACYRQAATLVPDNANIAFDWGFLLSQMGRMDESNRQFEKALELKYEKPDHCWYFI